MLKIILSAFLLHIPQVCLSQPVYKIGNSISLPDLRIRIGETQTYPDIKIKIGMNLPSNDFTVGRTNDFREADFAIVKGGNYGSYDYKILYGNNISNPDISIRTGRYIEYPDIKISIKSSGTVDYLYYDDSDYDPEYDSSPFNTTRIVLAFLTVINKKLGYKYKIINSKIK